MSEHLPECIDIRDEYQVPFCICAPLRAAEQRGYDRALGDDPVESDPLYQRGVKAARDAVEAIPTSAFDIGIVSKDDALAAIDSLRDKP